MRTSSNSKRTGRRQKSKTTVNGCKPPPLQTRRISRVVTDERLLAFLEEENLTQEQFCEVAIEWLLEDLEDETIRTILVTRARKIGEER